MRTFTGAGPIPSSAFLRLGNAGSTNASTTTLPSGPLMTSTLPPGPLSIARLSVSFVVSTGMAPICARYAATASVGVCACAWKNPKGPAHDGAGISGTTTMPPARMPPRRRRSRRVIRPVLSSLIMAAPIRSSVMSRSREASPMRPTPCIAVQSATPGRARRRPSGR